MRDEDLQDVFSELSHLLDTLEPYQNEFVLIGGLVPVLYRQLPGFSESRIEPLFTTDIDLATPDSLPSTQSPSIRQLLDKNDFSLIRSRQSVSGAPPKHFIQSKRFGDTELGRIHAEFLTPLKGSETTRDDKPKSPTYIQEDITAERLRYIDLAMAQPMKLDLSNTEWCEKSIHIQIPRPLTFIFQKVLSCDKRNSSSKKNKDYAYIYDVSSLSHDQWGDMTDRVSALQESFPDKWINRATEYLKTRFETPRSEGAQGAATKYESVTAKNISRTLNAFINEVKL